MQTVKSFRLIILARLDLDLEFSLWFLWGLNKTIKYKRIFSPSRTFGLLHFFHINWIGIMLHKVNITIFLINLLPVNYFIQDTKYS